VLRVLPPTAVLAAAAAAPAAESSGVVTRPIGSGSIAATQVQPGQASSAAARPVTPAAAAEPVANESGLSWIWPVPGPVIAGFDEVKNKGLDLGGTAGEPVLAAADGRVVYVGAGLRGYGNLIILKHNNTYLTAYAHNKTLLVKEDQAVRKGQKIAEMGNSDADRVKLHFEVRRQGKPVDPVKYLPPR
jgi:lipoprotein NlpD